MMLSFQDIFRSREDGDQDTRLYEFPDCDNRNWYSETQDRKLQIDPYYRLGTVRDHIGPDIRDNNT